MRKMKLLTTIKLKPQSTWNSDIVFYAKKIKLKRGYINVIFYAITYTSMKYTFGH